MRRKKKKKKKVTEWTPVENRPGGRPKVKWREQVMEHFRKLELEKRRQKIVVRNNQRSQAKLQSITKHMSRTMQSDSPTR